MKPERNAVASMIPNKLGGGADTVVVVQLHHRVWRSSVMPRANRPIPSA